MRDKTDIFLALLVLVLAVQIPMTIYMVKANKELEELQTKYAEIYHCVDYRFCP
jgi:uncharacterized membrane protein (DUF485 family)